MRQKRKYLAADTSFPVESGEGLPKAIKDLKSTCDPLKALTHANPC